MPQNFVLRTPKEEPCDGCDEYEEIETPSNAAPSMKMEPEESRTEQEPSSAITLPAHPENEDRTSIDTKRGVRETSETTTPEPAMLSISSDNSTGVAKTPATEPDVAIAEPKKPVLPPILSDFERTLMDAIIEDRARQRSEYHIDVRAFGILELSCAGSARSKAYRLNEIPDDHFLFLAAIDDQKKVAREINQICRICMINKNRVYLFAALAVLEFLLVHGCGYIADVVNEDCSEIRRALEIFKRKEVDQIHLQIGRIEELLRKTCYRSSEKEEKLLKLLVAFQNGTMRSLIEGSQQPVILIGGEKKVLIQEVHPLMAKLKEKRALQNNATNATELRTFADHSRASQNSNSRASSSKVYAPCKQNGNDDKNGSRSEKSGKSSNSRESRTERPQENNESNNPFDRRSNGVRNTHYNEGIWLRRSPEPYDNNKEASHSSATPRFANSDSSSQQRKTSFQLSASEIKKVAWRFNKEYEEPMSPSYTPEHEYQCNSPMLPYTCEEELDRDPPALQFTWREELNRQKLQNFQADHHSLPLPNLVEQPRSHRSSIKNPVESEGEDDAYEDCYHYSQKVVNSSDNRSAWEQTNQSNEHQQFNHDELQNQNQYAHSSNPQVYATSSQEYAASSRHYSTRHESTGNEYQHYDDDAPPVKRSVHQSRSRGESSQNYNSQQSTSNSSSSRRDRSTYNNSGRSEQGRDYKRGDSSKRSGNSKRRWDGRQNDAGSSRRKDDDSQPSSAKRRKDKYNDYLNRRK